MKKMPTDVWETAREAVSVQLTRMEEGSKSHHGGPFQPIWDEAMARYKNTLLWLQEFEEELTK